MVMDALVNGARGLGLELGARQLEQFLTYFRLLIDWNRQVNLTAVTGYEEVQTRHFLDSLTVLPVLPPAAGGVPLAVIDVGTGAGFPGMPLKIALPDIRLVLLEATAKKARFLQALIAGLGLEGAAVVVGRAEEAAHQPGLREKFNVVVSRAVAPLPVLAELCLPFCAPGGVFLAQKGGNLDAELNAAARAIDLLGGKLREVKGVTLAELAGGRSIVVVDKVRPTPERYPRRPGMPAKRPLLANGEGR